MGKNSSDNGTYLYRQRADHGDKSEVFLFFGASPPASQHEEYGPEGWWFAETPFNYKDLSKYGKKRCNTSLTYAWSTGTAIHIPVYGDVPISGLRLVTIQEAEAESAVAEALLAAPGTPPNISAQANTLQSKLETITAERDLLAEENEQLHRMRYDRDGAQVQAKYRRVTPGPTVMRFACGTGWLERCAALTHLVEKEVAGVEAAAGLKEQFVGELYAWSEFSAKMRQSPQMPFRT